jgi:hypothetical protein
MEPHRLNRSDQTLSKQAGLDFDDSCRNLGIKRLPGCDVTVFEASGLMPKCRYAVWKEKRRRNPNVHPGFPPDSQYACATAFTAKLEKTPSSVGVPGIKLNQRFREIVCF